MSLLQGEDLRTLYNPVYSGRKRLAKLSIMASTTTTMEMQPRSPQQAALRSPKDQVIPLQEEPGNGLPETTRPCSLFSGTGHVVSRKERWNNPKINTWRLAAIFYAFIVFGMNDASYGALIPYVCHHFPAIELHSQSQGFC